MKSILSLFSNAKRSKYFCFILLLTICSILHPNKLSASVTLATGDTICIKGLVVDASADTVYRFVTSESASAIDDISSPDMNSLWRITYQNDTISFCDIVTNRYMAIDASNTNALALQTDPFYWVLYDNDTKMHSAEDESLNFSFDASTGFVANAVPIDLILIPYFYKLQLYDLIMSFWTLHVDSVASDTIITISSNDNKYYMPADTAVNPMIIDTLSVPYTLSSNESWIQINADTIQVATMANEEFRQGTINLARSNNTDTTVIRISQFNPGNSLNLAHYRGMSGRALLSNGLQAVTEYKRIYFCTSGQNVNLNYPLTNGDRAPQAYYRWFNYTTLGTVSSALNLSSRFKSFTNNTGKYYLGYDATQVTYSVTSSALPITIACEASNYTDYNKVGNNFYEPTLSYRALYELQAASVIADSLKSAAAVGSSPTDYFENYTVTAPISETIYLSTRYDCNGSLASYYAYNTSGTIQRVTSVALYANGVKQTLKWNDGRSFVVPTINSSGVVTYLLQGTLSDSTKVNIAKYSVTYVSQTEVGPIQVGSSNMLATNAELFSDYYYLGGDWYYGISHNAPFTNWQAATLGYAYNSSYKAVYPRRFTANAFASAFEYQFISTTTFAQASYITSGVSPVPYTPYPGYNGPQLSSGMLYVNPAGNRVTVSEAAFSVTDYKASDEFFVTLYVNNVSQYLSRTFQLTFYVEELVNGSYVPVLQYITGSLSTRQGRWFQVGWHFQLPTPVTGNYRVRVENSGNASMRNNYLLNQFGIYQKRSFITAYGVYNGCASLTDSIKQVALQISFDSLNLFTAASDSIRLYYQCTDSTGTVIPLVNNTLSTTDDYGSIWMKNVPTVTANYPIYANTADSTALMYYLAAKATASNYTGAFYCDQTDYHYFCLIFESDQLNACQSYKVNLYNDASLASSALVGSANFVPIGMCIYQINGDASTDVSQGICPSTTDSITIKQQVMLDEDKFAWVNGYYDWIKGDASSFSGSGCYAGYDYDSVLAALRALHTDTTYMDTKVLPTAATAFISSSQLKLLQALISDAVLWLYQQKLNVALYDTVNYFTLYGYPDTMMPDDEVTDITLCNDFISIAVTLKSKTPWLQFGRYGETYNTTGAEVIRQASLNTKQVNGDGFTLPVKSCGYTFTDTLLLGDMLLIASSDTLFNSYLGKVLFEQVVLTKSQDSLLLKVNSRNSAVPALTEGETYDVLIELTQGEGSCSTGYQRVRLIVQPATLYWQGTSGTSWNNGANWSLGTSDGSNAATTQSYYAALKSTNIIIPQASVVPVVYPSQATDTNSAQLLMHDLTYEVNRCQNIYFAPQAMLVGQEYLSYDSAFLDVTLPTKQWVLMSAPIRGLVSGDLYVSTSAATSNAFSSLGTCNSRLSIPFWQSVYNSYVESQSSAGSTSVGNVSWSNPSNGMATDYVPRSGFCVWVEDYASSKDTITLRLPKSDASYYYFNADDSPSSLSIDVARPNDYYKLAFIDSLWSGVNTVTHYSDSSRLGLTGNPFMTTLYASSFFDDNPHLTGSYWVVKSGAIVACSSSGESTSTTADVVNIKPYEGFFVQTDTSTYFKADAMTFYSSATYPQSSKSAAPSAAVSVSRLYLTAMVNGHASTVLVVEKPSANDGYVMREDVELLLFDTKLTPSALYTVAGNRALQINVLSQLQRVPLGMKQLSSTNTAQRFMLSFQGCSSFAMPLGIFDSVAQRYYGISDDTVLDLELPTSAAPRYFIVTADTPDMVESLHYSSLHVYTPERNSCVVQSLYPITHLRLYDSIGRVIVEKVCHHTLSETLNLSSGVYVLVVSTAQGTEKVKVVMP